MKSKCRYASVQEGDTRAVRERKWRRQGSITLEAAVILPFTAAFWVAILFFFQVLQVETGVQESLFYAGRLTAVEACKVENNAALFASAEVLFRKELSRYPMVGRLVKGGSLGVTLINSKVSEDVLSLQAIYTVRLPFAFFQVPGLRIVQCSNNKKWNGKTVESSDGEASTEETQTEHVYVTQTGTVYHKSADCSYLKLSIHNTSVDQISSLRSKDGSIYYPCSCCGGGSGGGTVYYTDYGTNYHASLTCSGLKRTTKEVELSEVAGMRACSKCGGTNCGD